MLWQTSRSALNLSLNRWWRLTLVVWWYLA